MRAIKKGEDHWIVISLGGSLIAPKTGIDVAFLKGFAALVRKLLGEGSRLAIITGGGKTAREYQQAAAYVGKLTPDDLDWLGIHATRLNAHLLRAIFKEEAHARIITDPEHDDLPDAKLVIGAGWKPGFSTDYDAAVIAKRLGALRVVNISNVDYVYDSDPKAHKDALKFERIAWPALRKIIGSSWSPGLNAPFDPVAAKLCEKERLEVAIVSGADLENVRKAIIGEKFVGTVVK